MGKLYLYIKEINNKTINDFVRFKIDEEINLEVKSNQIGSVDVEDGVHNMKMDSGYMFGSDKQFGYNEANIEVSGNTYYVVTPAAVVWGKTKLKKVNFNSVEEFEKYAAKTNSNIKKIGTILFIIAVLIVIWSMFD